MKYDQHEQILTLYAQRPIVEKQAKYAFYHPFAEAIGESRSQQGFASADIPKPP